MRLPLWHKFLLCMLCLMAFSAAECLAAEEGLAAYYSDKFQGRKTASGERYDKNKLTGAHKTLAFGTKVKVTNIENKQSVIVKINDRGPYSKKRIIDLSRVAAKKIALIKPGIAKVKIEVIN